MGPRNRPITHPNLSICQYLPSVYHVLKLSFVSSTPNPAEHVFDMYFFMHGSELLHLAPYTRQTRKLSAVCSSVQAGNPLDGEQVWRVKGGKLN